MQRKSATLSLVALAALFAGCEWTGTSGSDSWSGSYDAMNFGGTYRITALTTLSEGDTKTSKNAADWLTDDDSGTFSANKTTASGRLSHQNVVPGSVKISCGNYMWMDDGGNILIAPTAADGNRSGNLVFGGGTAVRTTTESGKTATYTGTVKEESKYYNCKLAGNLLAGSVSVRVGGSGGGFKDNGDGTLTGINDIGTGFVNYQNGDVSLSFAKSVPVGTTILVSYKTTDVNTSIDGVTGDGTILYSSGAWSISVRASETGKPVIFADTPVRISYSYYPDDNTSTTSYTGIDTTRFDPNKVTSVTVTQTGQNLTMSFNNGIVMAGKFTSVRQTAAVSKDTGAGADTYNAQFQVQSGSDSKMVGTLNYDYPTHNRLLDGTWTWGRKTFDVHATGPAWTESGNSTTAETTYGND